MIMILFLYYYHVFLSWIKSLLYKQKADNQSCLPANRMK